MKKLRDPESINQHGRNAISLRAHGLGRHSPARQRLKKKKGAVSRFTLIALASLVLLVLLMVSAISLRPDSRREIAANRVKVYCASSVAQPLQKLVEDFNENYGGYVEIVRTGGSGELAGQLQSEFETQMNGGADMYVTADEELLKSLLNNGIVCDCYPLAQQRPVIAVAYGSDLKCDCLQDLLNTDDVRMGVASVRAAVGRQTRVIARRVGVDLQLEDFKTMDAENVMVLAQALVAGSVDVAVIWDSTVRQVNSASSFSEPALKIIAPLDPLDQTFGDIALGVVSSTEVSGACLEFCRYLTEVDSARQTFETYGFALSKRDDEVFELGLSD
jgi:ABC-type molybdate transport system substrate-binding protein